jgi:hypothetical protein
MQITHVALINYDKNPCPDTRLAVVKAVLLAIKQLTDHAKILAESTDFDSILASARKLVEK